MIKRPPSSDQLPKSAWAWISEYQPERRLEYLDFYTVVDSKGRYLPFDEFRHRIPKGLAVDIAWALTKEARSRTRQWILGLGEPARFCYYNDIPAIQKTKTLVDQATTTAALAWANRKIGEEQNFSYMLEDLIEDEAISSSQLEGAATTTLVAREMIKRRREPRTMDERMILGNFRMMRYVWDKRSLPLTTELIRELHAIGVAGIDDEKYRPGIFRSADNVVVEDSDGNIVHQPPIWTGLEDRLNRLCHWVNTDHDEIESQNYIHPLIKAISIHFAIGYEHPFNDGNGRVARALFYWFLFKKDYGAFRYISISNLLKEAATQYGKSYLYTETDEMDLTYFVDYQCSVIMRAIAAFKSHCQRTIEDIERFNKWLFNAGIYAKLTEKQKIVFQVAKGNSNSIFTARYVEERLGCSYNTAASVLNGLVDLELFEKRKDGKEWVYRLRSKNDIQNSWTAS